jgi:hypothetical protein
MPKVTVDFFADPFSKANRSIPLIEAGSTAYDEYKITSVDQVQVTEDLDKTIEVPIFSGWQDVNAARIGTSHYWVVASGQSTRSAGSVSMILEFNPATSLIAGGATLTGWWDRTPTRMTATRFNVKDDSMELSRRIRAPTLPKVYASQRELPGAQLVQTFWVQITFTSYLHPDEGYEMDHSTMHRLGCFVGWDPTADGSGWDYRVRDRSLGAITQPSIMSIITDIDEITGYPPSSVTDVSISIRCPYEYSHTVGSSSSPGGIGLIGATSGTPVSGREYSSDHGTYRLYELDYIPFADDPLLKKASAKTLSMSLTEMETDLGSVSLTDDYGQRVASLSPSPLGSVGVVLGSVLTYSDYTGLYDIITLNSGQRITLTGGKLPWIGDSWQEYKVRSMDSDRSATQQAISQASSQRYIDMANAAVGGIQAGAIGMLAGGPAGLAMGVSSAVTGIATSEAQRRLIVSDLRFQQTLSEKRVRDSAPSFTQTGYGLDYCHAAPKQGLSLELDMPARTTQAEYEAYIAEFGHPHTGLKAVTLSGEGFIKGRLPTPPVAGLKGELLNLQLVEGIKFKVI